MITRIVTAGRTVTARRAVAAVTAAAATALLAACGSPAGQHGASGSSSPATGTASAPATSSASAGSTSPSPTSASRSAAAAGGSHGGTASGGCATSSLSVTVSMGQAGATAGSTYVPLDFMNTSHRPCTMYGFPGVSFVTARGGSEIGAAATRITSYPSTTVSVPPGGFAHAWVQVAQAGNFPSSTCKPLTANWLRIYPPNNTAPAYVNHSFPACASGRANVLSVMPVRSGAGVRGHAP